MGLVIPKSICVNIKDEEYISECKTCGSKKFITIKDKIVCAYCGNDIYWTEEEYENDRP